MSGATPPGTRPAVFMRGGTSKALMLHRRVLPTGAVRPMPDVPGLGPIEASLVDTANACVSVRAADLGLAGTELPGALEAEPGLLALMRGAVSVDGPFSRSRAGGVDDAGQRP